MNPVSNLPLWNVLFGMARLKHSVPDLKKLSELLGDTKIVLNIYVIIQTSISEFEFEYLILDIARDRVTKLTHAAFLKKYLVLKPSYIITNMIELPESESFHTLFRPALRITVQTKNIMENKWQSTQLAGLSSSAT